MKWKICNQLRKNRKLKLVWIFIWSDRRLWNWFWGYVMCRLLCLPICCNHACKKIFIFMRMSNRFVCTDRKTIAILFGMVFFNHVTNFDVRICFVEKSIDLRNIWLIQFSFFFVSLNGYKCFCINNELILSFIQWPNVSLQWLFNICADIEMCSFFGLHDAWPVNLSKSSLSEIHSDEYSRLQSKIKKHKKKKRRIEYTKYCGWAQAMTKLFVCKCFISIFC